jgi:hypothetical protein
MFAMLTMVSAGGVTVTSNFAKFAHDFGVADLLVLGLAALPFALTVDRLLNGSGGCQIESGARMQWASPSGSRPRRS